MGIVLRRDDLEEVSLRQFELGAIHNRNADSRHVSSAAKLPAKRDKTCIWIWAVESIKRMFGYPIMRA